jgi:4-hydroxy-tetrahydrodipicolinate reductase
MSDAAMKLVVVGAAGRMGQTLIRLIHSIEGVTLHAAGPAPARPSSARMPARSPASARIGVIIGDDPLAAFLHADGVLDFTTPADDERICRTRSAGPYRACHRHDRLFAR